MFPERLKELRKNAGYANQTNIAKELKISQQTYSQWESGKREPSKKTLEKLSNFFNVSTDYLLGNTDIKNPDDINLSEFELLYRKTSINLSDDQKAQLEKDLKAFLIERQRLMDEKFGKVD
ncbi:transcriptional regulator [Streptococcus iniae]|uniref:helix-turn-helix domain-containing protein n=1 Tax=Streptococcus iniae TaxID=1346 RepID=UPI000EF7532D|nr:helix-turn-helix transcriptional regulator [Streptococcus iniae]RLV27679.1 transcriptional regulator [Streptococcus iniae]